MPSIAEVNVAIGAFIEPLVKNLKTGERALKASGRRMERLGNSITTSISLPLAGVGLAGAKMARDVSQNFNKIENLVGVTGTALNELKDGVKSVSGEVGKSQSELSDALFAITSAGIKGADAMDVLTTSSKASVIGMGKTRDIALAATSIMTAYGPEVISASEAVNQLTKTVKAGNLEAADLAPTIGKVIPIAQAMGIEFGELGANIATFTRLGIKAPEAVTALKALLSNLVKPGKQATDALKSVGLSAEGVRNAIKEKGLAAVLQDLRDKFDGNTTGAAALFGSVEGLANFLGTTGKRQSEVYNSVLADMNDGVNIVDQGFKNASEGGPVKFETAMVRLQNVSIDIGNVLIPIITRIADVVATAAEKFSRLDQRTQDIVVAVAGIIAISGPLITAMGNMMQISGFLKGSMGKVFDSMKNLAGGVLKAADAFRNLNTAQKASIIGAVVTAVIGAIAIYKSYKSELSDTEKIQKSLNDITTTATQNIVTEKLESQRLVDVLKDKNASYDDQKKALGRLQEISPKYFGNLDIEKNKLVDVDTAQKNYLANLVKMAKAKEVEDRLVSLQLKLEDNKKIVEESEVSWWQYGKAVVLGAGNPLNTVSLLAKSTGENIKSTTEAIKTEISALEDLAKKEDLFGFGETKPEKETPPKKGDPPTITTEMEVIPPDPDAIKESMSEITGSVEKLKLETMQANDSLLGVPEKFQAISEVAEVATPKLATMGDKFREIYKESNLVVDMMTAVSKSVGDMAAKGELSFKKLGQAALSAALEVVRAKVTEAIAAFVADSFIKFGVAGAAVAAGAGAVVNGLMGAAIKSVKPPALAKGGLAYGPTLAVVGDNPGAKSDPEVISPLSKLKNMINEGGQTATRLYGDIRLQGSDLLIAIENAQESRLRLG